MKFFLVLTTVLIGICTSLLLNFAAKENDKFSWLVLSILFAVILINFIRFRMWGWLHKRFDVSKSYPLTALFFPLIFIVSCIKGEAHVSFNKILGIVLILLGILVFERRTNPSEKE